MTQTQTSPKLKYRKAETYKGKSRLLGSSSSSSSTSGSDASDIASPVEDAPGIDVSVEDLDEAISYAFHDGQSVWVKVDGEWCSGVIWGRRTRRTPTRKQIEGLSYPVQYGDRKRGFFAPENGELKPDTPEVRSLVDAYFAAN